MFFTIARKGYNEWWRYAIGLVFVLFSLGLGQMLVFGLLSLIVQNNPNVTAEDLDRFFSNPDFSLLEISKNTGLILLVSSFIVALIALYLVVRYIHGRKFLSIITWRSSLDWSRVLFGFGVWIGIGLVFEVIQYVIQPESYVFHWNPGAFFFLVCIAIFILPIQTSFEELLIRGYLMQGVGLRSMNRWAPLLFTSFVFTAMHWMNPEIAKYGFWEMTLYYSIAGLFLGIVTLMDDSIELVLGIHAATNFYGAVIVSYEASAIQTDSLFRSTAIDPLWMSLLFLMSGIIFYFWASRKYKWPSIRKLWERIAFEEEQMV